MSDPFTVRLLGAIAATLKQNVKPAIQSSEAELQLDSALRALDFLAQRQSMMAENLTPLLAAERRDVAELAALMRAQGKVAQATRAEQVLASGFEPTQHLETLEKQRFALEGLICDLAPDIVELATGAGSARAGNLLKNIVAAQAEFIARQDPESVGNNWVFGGESLQESGAKKGQLREIDEASLSEYLRAKFPARKGIAAKDVRHIAGGFSKRTVFFTLTDDAGAAQKLVIRMDLPGPERMVKDEFPVLQKVFAAGLPVAEPHWLEADAKWFGGAFMVSSQCAGKTGSSELIANPAKGEALCRELAVFLAKLHAVDFKDLYPEAKGQPAGECLRREIIKFYDYYRDHAKSTLPQPLIDLCYSWLLSNLPKETMTSVPSLVHTDVGFHNILIDGDRISAVLDWETIHVGDHAEELYYTKSFVTPIMPWEKFLGYYYQAGGKPCPESSKSFYDVWHGIRVAANAAQLRATFEYEMPDALPFAIFGYIFSRRIELGAGNVLASFVK